MSDLTDKINEDLILGLQRQIERLTAEVGRIPLYAMLDVWMALGLDSNQFEPWVDDDLGGDRSEAWAFLLAKIRGDDLSDNHNPPPGRIEEQS